MELKLKPRTNPAVVHHEAPGGEVVMVNLDTAASLLLNRTGYLVWQLVDGRRTVAQIVDAVRRRFPDAPPEVVDDVRHLLEILVEDGFIGFEWTPDA